jgi:hypothetical protein
VLDIPASDLSAEEAAALLFMREEEKLARDVYNALYATWGQQTFTNIASSEQMHMDEIKVLMDRYALTDPALAEAGQFTNPELQALYTQLVAQGNLSLADALKVGAAIEEIDILDLQTRMAQTDNADIQQVYTSLMNGSYSHLKAFTGTLLTQTGETYVPQYMTAEQYQTIISSTSNGQGEGQGTGSQGTGGQGQGGGQGTGSQGQGGQGQGGQGAASGTMQADLTAATTIHGTVVSFDQMGLSLTLDDGSAFYVQLGNSRYSQTIGFAPAIGAGVTVYGFPGDQGAYSAITVTVDATAQVYAFRDATTGQPLWSGGGNGGGNGKGGGGNH